MAQKSKIVDITQSYVPIDPQAFPETLGLTAKEDDPIKDMSILAFEGYNFLPTSYGYRSYFNTATLVSFDALPKPCDKLLAFQSKIYENSLIAFCSDGIYMVKVGDTAWVKIWALTDTWLGSGVYSQYTWCVIENTLYIYRQGAASVLSIKDDLTYSLITPDFLNMSGQLGIFKANGSLAFWDSENSIAWSNVFDFTDFTPSVENQVGNTIFFGVQGRIVHIQDHGDGFVIYATRSIVGVTYSNTSTAIWDAGVVTSESGVAHPGAITVGTTNQEHFVYTNTGIMKIGHYNALSRKYDAAPILPELFDYLKESRSPVYLACHAARFLYFSLVDADYIGGRTSFTDVEVPATVIGAITLDDALWESLTTHEYLTANTGYNVLASYLRNPSNAMGIDEISGTFNQPYWTAVLSNLNHPYPVAFANFFNTTAKLEGATRFHSMLDASMLVYAPDFTVEDLSDLSMNWNAATDLSANVADFTQSFILPHNYNKTVVEDLVATADNISSKDASLYNVFDVLYNWYAVYKHFDNVYLPQYITDVLAQLAAGMSYSYKVRTSSDHIETDMSLDTYPRSFGYFPKPESITNIMTIEKDPASSLFQVRIERQYSHYYKFDFSASYRSYEAPVPVLALSIPGSTKSYETSLSSSYGIFPINLVTTSVPTLAELQAHFTANPLVTVGGDTFTPKFTGLVPSLWSNDMNEDGYNSSDRDRVLVDIAVTIGTPFALLQSVATATIALTYEEVAGEPMSDSLFNKDYYLYRFVPWGSLSSVTYPFAIKWSISASYHSIEHLLWRLKYNFTGLLGTIDTIGGPSIAIGEDSLYATYSSDGTEVYIHANGTAFGPVDYVGVVILVVRIDTINEIMVTDHIVCTVTDVTTAEVTDSAILTQFSGMATLTHTKTENYAAGVLTSTDVHHTANTDWNRYWGYNPSFPLQGSILAYAPDFQHLYKAENCCLWYAINKDTTPDNVWKFAEIFYHDAGNILNTLAALGSVATARQLVSCVVDGYEIPVDSTVISVSNFSFPGTSYTLQDGVPIPGYPTKKGALVFDLHLKRWGKYKGDHKALVEYAPINAVQNAVIPYTNFGMDSGILAVDGKIRVFSTIISDSYMRYGKIGYYRFGVSRLLEVRAHFRTKSTGKIVIDASLEGRSLDTYLQMEESYTDVLEIILYPDINAKWFTISIHGQYDLQYVEFRGNITSRR